MIISRQEIIFVRTVYVKNSNERAITNIFLNKFCYKVILCDKNDSIVGLHTSLMIGVA